MGWTAIAVAFAALMPVRALAHCDGLDGPVVQAAERAIAARNPALVLIWVQEQDEAQVRAAFEQTLAVRGLSPQARALADRFFFETVVRLHRAGEGAPFTGLQPAGRDLGPAIPAADRAVHSGSLEPVAQLLTRAMQARLHEQFDAVMATRAFDADDLAAGRAHVKAYVEFVHLVERLAEAAHGGGHGHAGESTATAPHR
jgi:hypothetical protein